MKRRLLIVLALLGLAVVPIACSLLFSGGDDAVAPRAAVAPTAAAVVGSGTRVPVFKGFEAARYQEYDALIAKCVDDFNAHRDVWAGATPEQAAAIAPLTAAQVKAHVIQETGGGDVRSRAAWAKDPLQANVPGDWNPYKKYLGLREPRRRNEGSLEKNLKAGLMLLSRKGFGVAGQPASNNRKGSFDGWPTSLKRYNGRSDKTADGRPYRDAYAERILTRAEKGERTEVEIPIRTKRK